MVIFYIFWRLHSLNELTAILINMELTHLVSVASFYLQMLYINMQTIILLYLLIKSLNKRSHLFCKLRHAKLHNYYEKLYKNNFLKYSCGFLYPYICTVIFSQIILKYSMIIMYLNMEVSDPKWVNSIWNVIIVNSLGLGGLHIIPLQKIKEQKLYSLMKWCYHHIYMKVLLWY